MGTDRKYKAIGFDMDGTLIGSKIDYDKLGNVVLDTLLGLGVPLSSHKHTRI